MLLVLPRLSVISAYCLDKVLARSARANPGLPLVFSYYSARVLAQFAHAKEHNHVNYDTAWGYLNPPSSPFVEDGFRILIRF